MYCPSCGSNNQDGVKFCTRCGTNLDLVSDALRARTTSPIETDERTVKLLKDYYRSRRMTIIGGVASLVALFKLALLLVLGFPDQLFPLSALLAGLLLYGLFTLIWGINKWNDSSSELTALGYSTRKAAGLRAVPAQLHSRPEQSKSVTPVKTDPLAVPVSITEHTTHFLDEQSQKQVKRHPSEDRH